MVAAQRGVCVAASTPRRLAAVTTAVRRLAYQQCVAENRRDPKRAERIDCEVEFLTNHVTASAAP